MPAPRLCPYCHRPTIGRCQPCRTERYGAEHQADRARWAPLVATGTIRCHRCNEPIDPTDDWHDDHPDDGSPRHPSHADCNVRATRSMG